MHHPCDTHSTSRGQIRFSRSRHRRPQQQDTSAQQQVQHSSSSSSSRWHSRRALRLLFPSLLLLMVLHAAVAVNIIYDATGWTKRDWHKYKIDHQIDSSIRPIDEAIKSPVLKSILAEAKLNSLDGPVARKATPKFAGLWAREDGSLAHSPAEDAVEAAAEAVQCTACHSLVSHVWHQVAAAINRAEPINEELVKDMLEEACMTQVPQKLLAKYRIVQVEAPEVGVSLFVVRERPAGSSGSSKQLPPAGSSSSSGSSDTDVKVDGTAAELAATQKACTDLVNHHAATLQKQLWGKAKDYFAERKVLAQKILTKMKMDADDPDVYDEPSPDPDVEESDEEIEEEDEYQVAAINNIPAAKLISPDKLCLDMDILCPFWAAERQCTENPRYMVGSGRAVGHCRASCRVCTQNTKWTNHPVAIKELQRSYAAAGTLLRTSACSASKACLTGSATTGGGAAALTAGAGPLLPGAVLAKTPGFVLGKPFWDIPKVSVDPKGSLTESQRTLGLKDPADEVLLSEGLGSKLVAIPGMDNYFMYQLEYKRRVYQFHKDHNGLVKEEHVLGRFDPAATAEAAKKDVALAAAATSEAARAWHKQWQLQQAAIKHASDAAVAADAAAAAAAGDAAAPPPAVGPSAAVAPPMLELLDYLPDTESMLASWWPFMRQMYTEGEACQVDGRSVDRQVELRTACSPDSGLHMLVREPEFCRYVMVLYHPALCEVPRLKPVPVLSVKGVVEEAAEAAKKKQSEKKKGGKESEKDDKESISKTEKKNEAATGEESENKDKGGDKSEGGQGQISTS